MFKTLLCTYIKLFVELINITYGICSAGTFTTTSTTTTKLHRKMEIQTLDKSESNSGKVQIIIQILLI